MVKLAAKLSLSVILFIVAFLLVELGTRFMVGPVSRGNMTPVPTSLLAEAEYSESFYVFRPNAEAVHAFGSDPRGYFDPEATLTYRINSLGFRGPETTPEKPRGLFRIVGLGDSFTFGTGVRQEDVFLACLQDRLNAGLDEARYEVLNLGIMGYDTRPEVELLKHYGLEFQPDLVVICFFLNDTGAASTHTVFNEPAYIAKILPWWRKSSRLLDHLLSGFERKKEVATLLAKYEASFEDGAEGWISAKAALRELKVLADQTPFKLMLTIFPVLYRLSDDYPFASIHAKIKTYTESLGIPTLDFQPAFEGYHGSELWVHPCNQHPNEVGHRIAGEALYRFILETPGLLDPP